MPNEGWLKRILFNKCRALRVSVWNMISTIPKRMCSICVHWLKKIPFEVWTSAMAATTVLEIAALSAFTLCLMTVLSWVLITLTYYHVRRYKVKTHFLSYWIMWWMMFMAFFLELSMPLLELLPEEHAVLIIFTSISIYLYTYNTRKSKLQHNRNHRLEEESNKVDSADDSHNADLMSKKLLDSNSNDDNNECTSIEMKTVDTVYQDSIFANAESKYCTECREFVSRYATHCHFCDCCVLQHYHHSLWLNCCIDQSNYPYYIINLVLGCFTLSFYANMVMTTICHPFVLLHISLIWILMPDDCSEVFDVYIFGLNFTLAVHALIMAVYMGVTFIQQMYLAYRYKRPIVAQIFKSYQH